tara:strand:- start:585 stop:785 length:201 start_codon:yes stop_codon:yes gene_type:complete
MVNYIIRENLKRLRNKIYNKQRSALEYMSNNDNETIKKDINEIFILEQVFDNWHLLYNEDSKEFWK